MLSLDFSYSGAINGAISIRAFGIQNWIAASTRTKVDKVSSPSSLRSFFALPEFLSSYATLYDFFSLQWSRTTLSFWDLLRWVNVSIDTLSNLFCASLAGYLLYSSQGKDAGRVGFLLNISVAFSSHILASVLVNPRSISPQVLTRRPFLSSPDWFVSATCSQ